MYKAITQLKKETETQSTMSSKSRTTTTSSCSPPSPGRTNKVQRYSPSKSPQPHQLADETVVIKVVSKKPIKTHTEQISLSPSRTKPEHDSKNFAFSPTRLDESGDAVITPADGITNNSITTTTTTTTTKNISDSKCCNCKYNTHQSPALRHKDIELEKLRKDLTKCQNELREELEKRGASSTVRAASDRDRARLLSEIKELGVSKRRLESALEEASSALKKKTQEVRLVKEACKQEVVQLERSTNSEIRKLLEDLKAKDHLLATLDRNQYSDRQNQIKLLLKQQQRQQNSSSSSQDDSLLTDSFHTALNSSSVVDNQSVQKHPRTGEGTREEDISVLQQKIADLQKLLESASTEKFDLESQNKDILNAKLTLEASIVKLRDENMQLTSDLNAVQFEVKRLNESLTRSNVEEMIEQFERLKNTTDVQKSVIRKLRNQIKNVKKPGKDAAETSSTKSKKTVRFLLPGEEEPIINGRMAYKEDMRFLFEDVISDNDYDDDDDDDNDDGHDDADYDDEIGYESLKVEGDIHRGDCSVAEAESDATSRNQNSNIGDCAEVEDVFGSGGDDDCESKESYGFTVESNDDDDDDINGSAVVAHVTPSEENGGNYKMLMKEHLHLEQSFANLTRNSPQHNWEVEKEALQLAVMALESKNHEYLALVESLKLKMEEMEEKNEELEFQVLEFEGCGNETLKKEVELADFALVDKNHQLEREIEILREKLQLGPQQMLPVENGRFSNCAIEDNDKCNAQVKRDDSTEYDIPESECDQLSCSETAHVSSTSSGFDDMSSDDENSVESMPHDEKSSEPPKGDHVIAPAKPSEDHWVKLVESLEMRLACSRSRERQLQDKLALLCEEKNRIIRDFDKYASGSDTDSLMIELDSGIGDKSLESSQFEEESNMDFESNNDGCVSKSSSSMALCQVSSPPMRLELMFDSTHMEDSYFVETPTSVDNCFHKNVRSLTVEDETDALHQRVCHLEKDCELLKGIVDMDEGVIRDLQFKVDELEGSEKNLSRVVDRLELVEKVLRASESAAVEENARLKVELTRSRSIEENLQSQLNLSRCDETQLRHKLEEVLEELKLTEGRLKIKTAETERERKALVLSCEKFEDHVGELEAVVELLKRRNQNLQRLCEDTNAKLNDSENNCKRFRAQAECMEQQRDAFVARIQAMEKERMMGLEKIGHLAESLQEKISELDMTKVEVGGLRACLEAGERETKKWIKKAEDRADAEVLLMHEMDELRREKETLARQLRAFYIAEVVSSVDASSNQHVHHVHAINTETQTEPTFVISEEDCCNNDEDETLMEINDDDDDDDDTRSILEASDISDEDDALSTDIPFDDTKPFECRGSLMAAGGRKNGKTSWGSLDSLLHKLGFNVQSVESSRVLKDKFTQTLVPLVPYLRRLHAASMLKMKKVDVTSAATGTSLIPLSTKYFGQSNSLYSRPPIKPLANQVAGFRAPSVDLLSDSMSVLSSCDVSLGQSTLPTESLPSPGPCASQ